MSDLEKDVREIRAAVRMLVNALSPTISFADVKQMLGVESDTTATAFLRRHSIPAVTRRRYSRLRVIAAIERLVPP